jgi:hypothetical protein
MKCINNFNNIIAKNWSKFDHLLEVLYAFGVGAEKEADESPELELVGLDFYFKHHFIEKACDFLLGRKSPLASPMDRRYEMGG